MLEKIALVKETYVPLQEKILKDILGRRHMCEIEDPEDGAEMIQKRFCNKNILLVLDDVDNDKQLEFLAGTQEWFGAGTHEWFGGGSRIIITTRDEHLLSDTNARYKAEFLLQEQAIELFSRHAFRKNSPPDGYEEVSNRAICYTDRLPLALKVLGSFFRGRKPDEWSSALDRLATEPDMEILKTLKISFDGLKKSEQQIFLDIACFFKGKEEERVTRMLDSFGFYPEMGIRTLIEKSLISVSNKRLVMHDLLQEMGLHIVRESYPNSRLWQGEKIKDYIQNKRELKEIEAIVDPANTRFDWRGRDEPYEGTTLGLSPDDFKNMGNLRLLDIRGKFTSCEPPVLPYELRWIRWHHYPFSSLGLTNKLVGLEIVEGKLENLRMGQKVTPYLKFITLATDRLKRFPDVSGAPNLEDLTLSFCRNLVEVHGSIGYHRKLVHLSMNGCSKLKCLPHRFEMESLETLDLSNCESLEKLPEMSSCMVKLSALYLSRCFSLQSIPNTICELKSLKILHLQDCNKLRKLPENLGRLEKLERLSLGFWRYLEIKWITESIEFHTLRNFCCVRILDLSGRQIEDANFFNNLGTFSSLEELYLSGNSKLVQLPASISRLSCLKCLDLNDCQQLQSIQALPSGIQVSKARNCKALEKIEDLTKEYVWLYKIWLSGCDKLLRNQENERYLENMLQQSFLKKCADLDRRLSIHLPGNEIPSWFEEQEDDNEITLKLSPMCHPCVMGFAVCVVFDQEFITEYDSHCTMIEFRMEKNGELIPKLKVGCTNVSVATTRGSVWFVYIPVSFFEEYMDDDLERKDWSHLVEGSLWIGIRSQRQVNRCGAYIMYGEDMESVQNINTCFSYSRSLENIDRDGNNFEYGEALEYSTSD